METRTYNIYNFLKFDTIPREIEALQYTEEEEEDIEMMEMMMPLLYYIIFFCASSIRFARKLSFHKKQVTW